VARVYLDPTALVLPGGNPWSGDEHVAPGAADAVAHLVDAGFDVILLDADAPTPAPLRQLPSEVRHTTALPEHLDPGTWYLTGEPYPSFGRPRGGTTVLVGPRRPVGRLPLPRFDLEARDMAAAAMEILTRDAMA
jgi:hypothetical protein